MGLDMYLQAKKYIGGWSHQKSTSEFDQLKEMFPEVRVAEGSPSMEVSFTVAYWRKANAIHNWFVHNVQNGVDDCGTYYVERSQLQQLREECSKVLKTRVPVSAGVSDTRSVELEGTEPAQVLSSIMDIMKEQALQKDSEPVDDDLLPPVAGFFFGTAERDEWYFRSLEETIEQIDNALADIPKEGWDWSFFYHSSW